MFGKAAYFGDVFLFSPPLSQRSITLACLPLYSYLGYYRLLVVCDTGARCFLEPSSFMRRHVFLSASLSFDEGSVAFQTCHYDDVNTCPHVSLIFSAI